MKQYASGIVTTIVLSVFLLFSIQDTNGQDQKANIKTVLSAETEAFLGIWEGFLQIGPKNVQNGAFSMAPLIDETMSPLVLQTIGEWILKATGKKSNKISNRQTIAVGINKQNCEI